ncbi:uncharacterized protein LOC120330420 isoform X2 [Styela clava]
MPNGNSGEYIPDIHGGQNGRRRNIYESSSPPHLRSRHPEHRDSRLPGVAFEPNENRRDPESTVATNKYPKYSNYHGGLYEDPRERNYDYSPRFAMSPRQTPENGDSSFGGMYSHSDSKYRWRKVRGNLDLFVMERNERHLTSLHWKWQKMSRARRRTPGYDTSTIEEEIYSNDAESRARSRAESRQKMQEDLHNFFYDRWKKADDYQKRNKYSDEPNYPETDEHRRHPSRRVSRDQQPYYRNSSRHRQPPANDRWSRHAYGGYEAFPNSLYQNGANRGWPRQNVYNSYPGRGRSAYETESLSRGQQPQAHGLYRNPDAYWDRREPYHEVPGEYSNYGYVPDYPMPQQPPPQYPTLQNHPHQNMPMHDKDPARQYHRTKQAYRQPAPWEMKNYAYDKPDYGLKMYYEEQMKLADERKKNEDTIIQLQEEQKEMEAELSLLRHKLGAELQRQTDSPELESETNEKIGNIEQQISELNEKLSETDEKLLRSEAERQNINTRQVLSDTASSKYGSEEMPRSPLFIIGDPNNGTAAAVAPSRYMADSHVQEPSSVGISGDSVFYEPSVSYQDAQDHHQQYLLEQQQAELEEQAQREMEFKSALEKQMVALKTKLEEQLQDSAEHMKEENGKIIDERVTNLEKQIEEMNSKIRDSDSAIRRAMEDKKKREDALKKEREEWHERLEKEREAREESAADKARNTEQRHANASHTTNSSTSKSPRSVRIEHKNFNGNSVTPSSMLKSDTPRPSRRHINSDYSTPQSARKGSPISKISEYGTPAIIEDSAERDSILKDASIFIVSPALQRRSRNTESATTSGKSPQDQRKGVENIPMNKISPSMRSQKVFPENDSSRASSAAEDSKSKWSSLKFRWMKSSAKESTSREPIDDVLATTDKTKPLVLDYSQEDDIDELDVSTPSLKKSSAEKSSKFRFGGSSKREKSSITIHSRLSDEEDEFNQLQSQRSHDGDECPPAEEGWGENKDEDKRSLLEGLGTSYCVAPQFIWKYLGDETDDEPITRKKCIAFILGLILILLLVAIIFGLIIGLASGGGEAEKSPIRFHVIAGNPDEQNADNPES